MKRENVHSVITAHTHSKKKKLKTIKKKKKKPLRANRIHRSHKQAPSKIPNGAGETIFSLFLLSFPAVIKKKKKESCGCFYFRNFHDVEEKTGVTVLLFGSHGRAF